MELIQRLLQRTEYSKNWKKLCSFPTKDSQPKSDLETFSFLLLSCQSTCLMWVTHTDRYFLFLNKHLNSASLQAWGWLWAVWEEQWNELWSYNFFICYSQTQHTKQHHSMWKRPEPPSSFIYKVRVCSTLEDFLSEMLCLLYRGFTHSCCPDFLIHGHWASKILLLKKRPKKSSLIFSLTLCVWSQGILWPMN